VMLCVRDCVRMCDECVRGGVRMCDALSPL
jgi:hypothetical protein